MQIQQIDRATLYERVWDTPMSALARTYGLSDVGLKKACARVGVPTPPRGYWARVRNGQTVPRPPLPPSVPGAPTSISIYEARSETPLVKQTPGPTRPRPTPPRPTPPTVVVPETLHGAHPLITEAKKALPSSYKDGYGRVSCPGRLDIQVTPENLNRALRILQAVLREAQALGYGLGTCPESQGSTKGHVAFVVDGECVPFGLFEKVRREEVPKAERRYEWQSRYRFRASGALVLAAGTSITSTYHRQWKETETVRLEDRIGEFLVAIPTQAVRQQEERRRQDEWRRTWEAERRRSRPAPTPSHRNGRDGSTWRCRPRRGRRVSTCAPSSLPPKPVPPVGR